MILVEGRACIDVWRYAAAERVVFELRLSCRDPSKFGTAVFIFIFMLILIL